MGTLRSSEAPRRSSERPFMKPKLIFMTKIYLNFVRVTQENGIVKFPDCHVTEA